MKKNKFNILVILLVIGSTIFSGCNMFKFKLGQIREKLKGRTSIVQTYDEESNVIDKIEGKSISISTENKFNVKDKEGNVVKQSPVVSLTIGGKSMVHVGSSLILYEKGLTDVFDEFSKTVNVKNLDRSKPFLNKMINDMQNLTTGKGKVVLVRSQSGKPLATFVGNKVSYFSTGIDKSTGIQIDGKYIFIYRCDYTIYDKDLLS